MVKGLPKFKAHTRVCEKCLVGKQQRDPFPKESTWRAFQILQLVHADICGHNNLISNNKKSKRIKLDDKSMKYILLGVGEESKVYHLFDPNSKRIVISRDVIFEEDKAWDWSDNYQETIMADLKWEMNEE
ncbi:hypothetical protein ACFXTN_002547 [Malus domestica]